MRHSQGMKFTCKYLELNVWGKDWQDIQQIDRIGKKKKVVFFFFFVTENCTYDFVPYQKYVFIFKDR